jgi:hypothetical protein
MISHKFSELARGLPDFALKLAESPRITGSEMQKTGVSPGFPMISQVK